MKTLDTFPDLGRAAAGLRISVDLESIHDNNLIGHSILKQLRDNNTKGAIDIIMGIAKDNRVMAIDILGTNGEDLLNRIEKYLNHEL